MIRDSGASLDWDRVLRRFGSQWRVLLAHLVLFGFIYPGERDRVPTWVMRVLGRRLVDDLGPEAGAAGVCRGTLLSREQYLVDLERLGYGDGRLLSPDVHMSPEDIAHWTRAIPGREPEEPHGSRSESHREQPGERSHGGPGDAGGAKRGVDPEPGGHR
jgi:hypothetical protein